MACGAATPPGYTHIWQPRALPELFSLRVSTFVQMFLSTLLFFPFFLSAPRQEVPASIYDFKITAIDSSVIDFSQFRGKKILIVNTASYCRYTPQYDGLQKLYNKYKDRLVIVGFPANNFLFEEPGSNQKVAQFCRENYGVTFPMAAKVSVKGRKKAAIYHWLTEKKYNGYKDSKVTWNFQKYLIDEQGKLIAIFYPNVPPDSYEITYAIEN
jgi:glutathione peroxidase